MADSAKKLIEAEPCTCVSCGMCGGSGNIRFDDPDSPFDELETCDECWGSGITEPCDRCQLLTDMEYDEGSI